MYLKICSILFYDVTSTYFEGKAEGVRKAQRGYSRDQRPDAKQVLVGLGINGDGFPVAHEIYEGNLLDTRTLDHMLDAKDRRVETHIFLCILAYHLLVAIEKTLLDQRVHTSWATVRESLKTHQVVTIVLPTRDVRVTEQGVTRVHAERPFRRSGLSLLRKRWKMSFPPSSM